MRGFLLHVGKFERNEKTINSIYVIPVHFCNALNIPYAVFLKEVYN